MKADFWSKVSKCKHEETPNYGVDVHCGHEELGCGGGFEWHCKHCGVYITEDPCGATSGMSGWPYRRWKEKRIWSDKIRWGETPNISGKRSDP